MELVSVTIYYPKELNQFSPYIYGFIFSAFLGHYFINLLMQELWKSIKKKPVLMYQPVLIGQLERVLYTASWLLGKPEFIGFWLVLKTAGQWKDWQKSGDDNSISGRNVFNVFLIGNAFSILYGVLGGLIVYWLQHNLIVHILTAIYSLVALNCIFWFYVKKKNEI